MNDIQELLSKYQLEAETRAYAHYCSSDYHRRRGQLWGIAASGFTGAAGLATLASAALKLDLIKNAIAESGLPILSAAISIAIVLFVFAVVSALAAFFEHPKQAAIHMASYAGYSYAVRRLEAFRVRSAKGGSMNSENIELFNYLDEVLRQIKEVASASIYPLPDAYRDGKKIKEWEQEFSKEWEKTFWSNIT